MATSRLQNEDPQSQTSVDVRDRFAANDQVIRGQEREQVVTSSRLPLIVVPFFLLIAVVIVMAFGYHQQHLKYQQQLYLQYVAQDKWRAPTAKEWQGLESELVAMQFDPTNPNWAKVDAANHKLHADEDRFLKDTRKFFPLPGANAVARDAREAFLQYDGNLYIAKLPETLRANRNEEIEARNVVVQYMMGQRFQNGPKSFHNFKEAAAWRDNARKKVEQQVKMMSKEEVIHNLKASFRVQNFWEGPVIARSQVDQDLRRPTHAPAGWDQ